MEYTTIAIDHDLHPLGFSPSMIKTTTSPGTFSRIEYSTDITDGELQCSVRITKESYAEITSNVFIAEYDDRFEEEDLVRGITNTIDKHTLNDDWEIEAKSRLGWRDVISELLYSPDIQLKYLGFNNEIPRLKEHFESLVT